MRVYLASDHAGFELKKTLSAHLRELGYECVEDLGPTSLDPRDDYPDYCIPLAHEVAAHAGSFGILIGASGQGEAIAANRVKGARAVVYYGPAHQLQTDLDNNQLDVIAATRVHNDANILSIGARFVSEDEAKKVAVLWLSTSFSGEERHKRRIEKLDAEGEGFHKHHAKK